MSDKELQFTNVQGDALGTLKQPTGKAKKKPAKKKAAGPAAFHKGFKVQGIPPGALEAARTKHQAETRKAAAKDGEVSKYWDEGNWLMNAKRKPVRRDPYGVRQAADECARMAEKAGWLRVEVVEVKAGELPATTPLEG
jgi:hypothetical protein